MKTKSILHTLFFYFAIPLLVAIFFIALPKILGYNIYDVQYNSDNIPYRIALIAPFGIALIFYIGIIRDQLEKF